jgi:hypothetical protein
VKNFILLILFFPILGMASPDEVGIILKLKDRNHINELNQIAYRLGLKKGYASTHLNFLQYKRSPATGELGLLCQKFLQHPGVKYCEVDRKPRPDSHFCETHESSFDDLSNIVQALSTCKLYTELPGSPPGPSGTTPLWAQEYTGADLVRADLESAPFSRDPEQLIDVLDTNTERFHGEAAASLIASRTPVGIIPSTSELSIFELKDSSGYIEVYDRYQTQLRTRPHYINNSMSWGQNRVISEAVSEITRAGAVFVTSAGNEGTELPIDKSEMADQIVYKGIRKIRLYEDYRSW